MDYRGLVVMSAALLAGAVPLLPACSGPDPGAITLIERPKSELAEGPSASTSGGDAGTTSGGAGDAGQKPAGDAGNDFFKGEAFKYEDPGVNANAKQPIGTHAGQTPLEGKNCVVAGCHLDVKPWAAAGTAYAAQAGGAFAGAKVQIRIVKPDGTTFAEASPDAQGNFWMEVTGQPPAGSHVAIRKEGGQAKAMIGEISGAAGAACNSAACHGTATNRIYAP